MGSTSSWRHPVGYHEARREMRSIGCFVAFCSATLVILASLAPRDARANGRFPASSAVVFSPVSDDHVLVRVTFGLLVTRDRGASWRWICERAIGFSGPEDPTYVITKTGAIVAGLFDGLRATRDGGCTWEAVKTDAKVFVDVTERRDGAIIALASSYDRHSDSGSLYKSQLYVSADDAKSFTPLGARMDPTLLAESVEVAASDPQRLYVSAVRGDGADRRGVLLVSTDAGVHWIERPVAMEGQLAPFIAAVDAKRADRVYIRTAASPENPTLLLVTDDAGKTYRKLLGAKGPLLGFALSPDGKTIHAGGPDDGLFAGGADAKELSQVSKLRVQCLGHWKDTLWACSSEAGGFVAGTAPALGDGGGDARGDGGGPAFQARLHLNDIGGPLQCATASAVAKECATDWQKLASDLGIGDAKANGDAKGDAGAARNASDAGVPSAANAETREAALGRDRGVWLAAVAALLGAAIFLVRSRRAKKK